MAELPCFAQIHALLLPDSTDHKLQEAFKNVPTQINRAFKSPVLVETLSVLPSLLSSTPKTIRRNRIRLRPAEIRLSLFLHLAMNTGKAS